jgi:glutamate synthase (ferredoxin)
MNRIGGKSNSGEGGEDRVRHAPITGVQEKTLSEADGVPRSLQGRTLGVSSIFPGLHGLKEGDSASSKIKQIASGRFGVTPEYLMRAEQLEIKIAQGAKPGEGGQLPGKKVNEYIASVRASTPGVTLISPPPHHDIYSIEDLAQLIYDLHQINPEAGVSVKLVSEVGIGTVASGVAKAGADIIQISGHDGGTGASPASSIKHAGSPWELGVAESHATLQRNGLRKKVLLRADGGLKSGWDVVMAAAMGAEEFGFGTIAMVAEGCILARICHTNKCPVGVATQNEALRKRFPGTPDDVVTFFTYVAEEVRQILAKLGYRTLDEMIGKPGVLRRRTDIELKKASGGVDPSFVLDSLECEPAARQLDFDESFCIIDDRDWLNHGAPTSNGYTLCDKILEDNDVATAIASNDPSAHVTKVMHIVNTDRAALARVSGVLADKYGDGGFKGHLDFQLTGGAGQSFAAFLSEGMSVTLRGYANDYVCKGMAGGQVVIAPPERDLASASSNSLSVAGNTVLYGATGGTLNVRGRTGERFAVRNSGALGVVEGMGDHGCEYMTNGRVLSLGDTGRNFGAGMTGGLAFVVTDEGWLNGQETRSQQLGMDDLTNMGSVSLVTLSASHGAAKEWLAETLKMHIDLTGSARATRLLDALDEALSSGKITAVVPASEEKSPLLLASVPVSAAANV